MRRAEDWIRELRLQPHPEGGWFRETYRATEVIEARALPERFDRDHRFSTAIYFLLQGGQYSALHRIRADEVWHFYRGAALDVEVISPAGEHTRMLLGSETGVFQAVVPAGCWFGAHLQDPADANFALVGCTVAPGFEFADFEMGDRAELLRLFPQHRTLVERLAR